MFQKGMCVMSDITKEYVLLFNAITDVEEALQELQMKLIKAQQHAEALFVERETDYSRTA